MTAQPRLLIWTPIPNHYQTALFTALRARGADLVVHYFQHVEADRLKMGWDAYKKLPAGERYVQESLRALEQCPDWRQRIHIVPGYSRLFLLRLARFLSDQRVPWLHWSEHSEPKLRSRVTFVVKRYYGRMVRRHALGALAIGRLAREEFVRWGIQAERIRFLPYVVPRMTLPDGHDLAEVSMEGPRFLFLGQLCPRKGIDLLLLAMRDVVAVHPAARLELVGNDLQDGEYARIAERLEIPHAVCFAGIVEPARIGTALSRCDVLILPSRHDGWGVVLNEAASVGKALIASDACGAAHHFIEPEVNGYRFPAGDRSALASAMLAYCRNPTLARRHGAESLRIFEDFTPDRNARRLEEAIESLQTRAATQVNVA
ncbi:MAG: glycosyltransferase family 4 protein [Gammaproteobacteria bacterium]|nr:glycosyltransferase family 4 protein [Gammaproteobacteria bacterium]